MTRTAVADASADRLLRVRVVDADRQPIENASPLENAQSTDVAKALDEAVVSPSASGIDFKVVVHPAGNAVVVSGTTAQVQEALKLVAQLDSPPMR